MAHAPEEVEEMTAIADSLVLNIGTLTPDWVESMIRAGQAARRMKRPVILDPVGAGATALRTDSAKRIIRETPVTVIRGNASEVLALGNSEARTRGVDSIHRSEDACETAIRLANELQLTLAVTGAVDLITDGKRVLQVENGHPLMSRITGSGCAATAVIGAFLAADHDPVTAAATALAFFGVAGEEAGALSSGPGSFMMHLVDALYRITPEELNKKARISEVCR
jgi:hydroxyethylthiazole kinase